MKIDRTWPLSASEQLKSQLRTAIRSGSLRVGINLPTVRALAEELELNPNTIASVYRDLASEGLLTKHRRGGTKIAHGTAPLSPEERQLQLQVDHLIKLARSQQCSGAELLRLIAGRWDSNDTQIFDPENRNSLYAFLQNHDYDQA